MAGAPNFQSLDGAMLGITREERGKVELEVEMEETEDFERGGMDGLMYGEDGCIKFKMHTHLRIRFAARRLKTTYAENVSWSLKTCTEFGIAKRRQGSKHKTIDAVQTRPKRLDGRGPVRKRAPIRHHRSKSTPRRLRSFREAGWAGWYMKKMDSRTCESES
ncbi:hypothetical protein B0H14DRAFT_2806110, partial [Mycena olivaceomarginata]